MSKTAMILIDRSLAKTIWGHDHQELYGCDTRDNTEWLIETQEDFDNIYESESTVIEFGIEGELFGEPYGQTEHGQWVCPNYNNASALPDENDNCSLCGAVMVAGYPEQEGND